MEHISTRTLGRVVAVGIYPRPCEVMHFGKPNLDRTYSIKDSDLRSVDIQGVCPWMRPLLTESGDTVG